MALASSIPRALSDCDAPCKALNAATVVRTSHFLRHTHHLTLHQRVQACDFNVSCLCSSDTAQKEVACATCDAQNMGPGAAATYQQVLDGTSNCLQPRAEQCLTDRGVFQCTSRLANREASTLVHSPWGVVAEPLRHHKRARPPLAPRIAPLLQARPTLLNPEVLTPGPLPLQLPPRSPTPESLPITSLRISEAWSLQCISLLLD